MFKARKDAKKMEIWLYRILITLVLGFLIWVIKWAINQFRKWVDKVVTRIDDLNKNVSDLTVTLKEQSLSQKSFKDHCKYRGEYVDGQFKEVKKRLDNLEK